MLKLASCGGAFGDRQSFVEARAGARDISLHRQQVIPQIAGHLGFLQRPVPRRIAQQTREDGNSSLE